MTKPLVSIGVPVHNEEAFLEETLQSILAQDYDSLEIIISDNASTDTTPEIAQRYARLDPRVRYYRNERNVGMVRNFNRVFELSSGEFFMWGGGHDLWSRNFVSGSVEEFQRSPDVVVCQGDVQCLDIRKTQDHVPTNEQGYSAAEAFSKHVAHVDTRGVSAANRFRQVITNPSAFWVVCGLMRSKAVKKISPLAEVVGADFITLARLSLEGHFAYLPNITFYFRCTSFYRPLDPRQNFERLAQPVTSRWKKVLRQFPLTHTAVALLRVVHRSNLALSGKIPLYALVLSQSKANVLSDCAPFVPETLKKVFRLLRQGVTTLAGHRTA